MTILEKDSKSVKVLYVAPQDSIDGSNTSLRNLIVRLKERSLIEELVLVPSEQIGNFFRVAGLQVEVLNNIVTFLHIEHKGYGKGFLGGIVRQLKSVLRAPGVSDSFGKALDRHNPDIVHLNEVILLWHAIVAHRRGIPVVMHVRYPVAKGGTGLRHWLFTQMIHRTVDTLITICSSYVKRLGVARSKCVVIPNPFWGIEKGPPVMEVKGALENVKQPRALLVGARYEKGLLETMRAIEHLDRVELMVVGTVPKTFLERTWHVRKPKLSRYHLKVARWLYEHDRAAMRIQFAGVEPDIYSAMAQSDVVLVPWMTPHFSRPLFEAWLMRRPVVAFDIEGVAEYCIHEENALLVPRGDWRALAKALQTLLSRRALARNLAEAGYETAISFIGNDDSELQVFKVYKEILSAQVRNA